MIDQKLTRKNDSQNVSASSNANETKQMQNNNCPLADGTHKLWNSPIFKSMNVAMRQWEKNAYVTDVWGKGMQSKIVKSIRGVYMDVPKNTTACYTQKTKGTRVVTQLR